MQLRGNEKISYKIIRRIKTKKYSSNDFRSLRSLVYTKKKKNHELDALSSALQTWDNCRVKMRIEKNE